MKPVRRERVASFLREEIARIVQLELQDPRVGLVSITRVEPTEDLKEATVHVSVFGSESQQRTAIRGLEAAAGYIQQALSGTHRWRQTPMLKFELDDTIRKQFEMDELIRKARESDEPTSEEE
ncbi:MAG: 30S ribosome-binding factor RbfA [Planctomycetes bacterium]|nr:30S ribosome-binding factor RbfA [Planctomycetota bacterium]